MKLIEMPNGDVFEREFIRGVTANEFDGKHYVQVYLAQDSKAYYTDGAVSASSKRNVIVAQLRAEPESDVNDELLAAAIKARDLLKCGNAWEALNEAIEKATTSNPPRR